MSQVQVEQVPAPPAPPVPRAPGQPTTIILGPGGATITQLPGRVLSPRDVAVLKQRGSELSRQLNSANNRRDELARRLEDAVGTSRQGLEQRIAQLDQRIMGIEAAIEENGKLLASAPLTSSPQTTTSTRAPDPNPFGMSPGQVTALGIVSTIFVLFPLSIAVARSIWKKSTRQSVPAAAPQSNERMERLEQAVDAIAIEVERISEGQRFVTRLLTEGTAPALSVGQRAAEPVRVEREALRASRETA